MRLIVLAALCSVVSFSAQAQQVETIKARGANAAGACAGSLDMVGQFLNRAANRDSQKISNVQQGRDFFADLPLYPSTEIADAANAFITLMSRRIVNAKTTAERESVERELVDVASKCLASARATIQAAARNNPGAPPATTQTVPLPAQPSVVQPLTVQPYTIQPLVLDPIVPAQ